MNRSETVLLAAYAVAGLVVLGCAFAPARSWLFRGWCTVLGGFVAAWPWWLMRSVDHEMPLGWRVGPLVVPVLLLLVTVPGVYQNRRARAAVAATLPEIEEEPENPDGYPMDVPIGELPPPHDPWKALYASLARQRAKWEEAAGGGTPTAAGATQTAVVDRPATDRLADDRAADDRAADDRAADDRAAVEEPAGDREDPPAGPGPSAQERPQPAAPERPERLTPEPPTEWAGSRVPRRRPRQYDGRHRQAPPRASAAGKAGGTATGTVPDSARLWWGAQA